MASIVGGDRMVGVFDIVSFYVFGFHRCRNRIGVRVESVVS